MTIQAFNIPYRGPNIVDVVIPKVAGRTGYRLKASPQFDGSPAFVQLFEMPAGRGYLDPTVDRRKLHTQPGAAQHLRAVFDPDTFNGTAAIQDNRQFWMIFQPVDGGVPGADSDPVLVLNREQHYARDRISIRGDAPNAATIAGSLTLCLARRMKDFAITNHDGANSLFVAFDPQGPEYEIAFGETLRLYDGAESTLVVRGNGGAVTFSANFTIASKIL